MLANAKQCAKRLKKFDDYKKLTGANQVDVRILRGNIDYEIFRLEGCATRNGTRLFTTRASPTAFIFLVARDFDSAQKRIPEPAQADGRDSNVIKQAEANLQHPHENLHRDRDRTGPGAINLVRNGLDPLLSQAPR